MSIFTKPMVFIVDDDAPLRRALSRVLRQDGWQVATFGSSEEFLAQRDPLVPGCLVLDIGLPGLDGLALQRILASDGPELPIVFLSGDTDVPMTARAIQDGAVGVLSKPVAAEALLAAVRVAAQQVSRAQELRPG